MLSWLAFLTYSLKGSILGSTCNVLLRLVAAGAATGEPPLMLMSGRPPATIPEELSLMLGSS